MTRANVSPAGVGLKIGDIVQLKSGGPSMTVTNLSSAPTDVDMRTLTDVQVARIAAGEHPSEVVSDWRGEDDIVRCRWFVGTKLNGSWFPKDALIELSPNL